MDSKNTSDVFTWQSSLRFLNVMSAKSYAAKKTDGESASDYQTARRHHYNVVVRLTPKIAAHSPHLIPKAFASGKTRSREALVDGLIESEPDTLTSILSGLMNALKTKSDKIVLEKVLKLASLYGSEDCGQSINQLLLNGLIDENDAEPLFEHFRSTSPGLQFLNSLMPPAKEPVQQEQCQEVIKGHSQQTVPEETKGSFVSPESLASKLSSGFSPNYWPLIIDRYVRAIHGQYESLLQYNRQKLNTKGPPVPELLASSVIVCALSDSENDIRAASSLFWRLKNGTEKFLALIGEPVAERFMRTGLENPRCASSAVSTLAKGVGLSAVSPKQVGEAIDFLSKPKDIQAAILALNRLQGGPQAIRRGVAKLTILMTEKRENWEHKFFTEITRTCPHVIALALDVASPPVKTRLLTYLKPGRSSSEIHPIAQGIIESLGPSPDLTGQLLSRLPQVPKSSFGQALRLALCWPDLQCHLEDTTWWDTVLNESTDHLPDMLKESRIEKFLVDSVKRAQSDKALEFSIRFAKHASRVSQRLILMSAESTGTEQLIEQASEEKSSLILVNAIEADFRNKKLHLRTLTCKIHQLYDDAGQNLADAQRILESAAPRIESEAFRIIISGMSEKLQRLNHEISRSVPETGRIAGPPADLPDSELLQIPELTLQTVSVDRLSQSKSLIIEWKSLVGEIARMENELKLTEEQMYYRLGDAISLGLENLCISTEGYFNLSENTRDLVDRLVDSLELTWAFPEKESLFDPGTHALLGELKADPKTIVHVVYPGLKSPHGTIVKRGFVMLPK